MKRVDDYADDMTPEAACQASLAGLARTATLELTPRQVLTCDDLLEWLRPGNWVYVPHLPNANYLDTMAACRHLLAVNLIPVPHFPARVMGSREQAETRLEELAELGVRHLMLIAGDTTHAAGPYTDSLAILDAGILDGREFSLGVAGHPEGHPSASGAQLRDALRIKRDYARATGTTMWVVSQFVFDAEVFLDWLNASGDVIAPLPVYCGIAGPTRLRTLMAYAAMCGVGASARVLLRQPQTARLLHSWTPDGLVQALAHYRVEHPRSLFQGLHLFPFGGLKRSGKWLSGLQGVQPGLNWRRRFN